MVICLELKYVLFLYTLHVATEKLFNFCTMLNYEKKNYQEKSLCNETEAVL